MPGRVPWRRRPPHRPGRGRRLHGPGLRRAAAGVGLLIAAAAVSTLHGAAHAPPGAAAILERAEEVRNPDLDYALEFTLRVSAPVEGWPDRESRYTMIARGRDHSIVLMTTPRPFLGANLLIAEGRFWFLPPRAASPIELSPKQVLQGDIAYGDLARANLGAAYAPRLDGEEPLEGEPCWRLELARAAERALYSRVRLWVEKRRFLPRRMEYYGETGALLRAARYLDYARGPLGLRAMRIEAESTLGRGERTTMTFENLRRLDATTLPLTPEGMAAVRDAVLSRPETQVPRLAEEILAALAPSRP